MARVADCCVSRCQIKHTSTSTTFPVTSSLFFFSASLLLLVHPRSSAVNLAPVPTRHTNSRSRGTEAFASSSPARIVAVSLAISEGSRQSPSHPPTKLALSLLTVRLQPTLPATLCRTTLRSRGRNSPRIIIASENRGRLSRAVGGSRQSPSHTPTKLAL